MKDSIADSIMKENTRGYDQIAEKFAHTRKFPWSEFSFFKKYVKKGDHVLDAGCGSGRLFEFLNGQSINYHGIDSSRGLVSIALQNYPSGKFQTGSITNLPWPDNNFDVIFCIATLHHIPGKKMRYQVLSEFRRVLKPHGQLIMTNWNLWNSKWWSTLLKFTFRKITGQNKMDWGDVTKPWKNEYGQVQTSRYLHAFSKREMKKLLSNKFEIEKQFYTKHDANARAWMAFNLVTIAKNIEK